MMKSEITLFGRVNWTTYGLKTISVDDAIRMIKDGTYYIDDSRRTGWKGTLKDMTDIIRSLPDGIDIQQVKEQYLPAVTFNGIYSGKHIVEYSSVTALDFDHIPNDQAYVDLFRRLAETPCVCNIFTSPSGKGIKALVLHDNNDPRLHDNLYQQLITMFSTPEIGTDTKNRDLVRRTYLCYDPDVWTNPLPVPFHFEYHPIQEPYTKQASTESQNPDLSVPSGSPSDASIMHLLKYRCKIHHPEYLREGSRRDGVFWFGTQAAKAGVDYQFGLDFVNTLYHSNEITLTAGGPFTEEEVSENYSNGYDKESYNENFRMSFKSKRTV